MEDISCTSFGRRIRENIIVHNFFTKLRSRSISIGSVTYLIYWRESFNPLTKIVFSSFAEALHISPNNRESPYSIVPSRFCTLSCSGGNGVVVVIRDSLLYAVTWQARKGRLEIPGSRRRASSYNSTRMRTSSRIGITITTYIYVGESRWDPRKILLLPGIVNFVWPWGDRREGIGFAGCIRV